MNLLDGGEGRITASESKAIWGIVTQNFPLKDTSFLLKKKSVIITIGMVMLYLDQHLYVSTQTYASCLLFW